MPRYAASYRRTSISSSTGAVSENSIVFSPSGGHSHDGQGSSLIDTTKYSIWDFPVNTVYSTTPRAARQAAHIEQFKNFVVNLVNTSVLEPAGVVLGDNVINANNIVAGSISSELIAANTIVANNIAANTITTELLATDAITSLNYSYTSGNFSNAGTFFNLTNGQIVSEQFAIDSSGNAYFAGDISAASGTFTGDLSGSNISGGTIDIGGADTTSFHVDSNGNMWLGASTYAGAATKFRVSNTGVLNATSATISGSITATSGSIGGVVIGSSKIYSGTGSYANTNTPFYLDSSGYFSLENKLYWNPATNLLTISGNITASTITGSSLSTSGSNNVVVSGSQITLNNGGGDAAMIYFDPVNSNYKGTVRSQTKLRLESILGGSMDFGITTVGGILIDSGGGTVAIGFKAGSSYAYIGNEYLKLGSHYLRWDATSGQNGYYGVVVEGQGVSTQQVRIGELYSAGGVHAPNSNLHLTGNSYVYIKGSGDPRTGGVSISSSGALSKNSGSFKIDHPLEEKSEDYWLYHSFIEGPYADLIYRGVVELVNGYAEVNIDTVSGMTDGTFVKLVNNVSCFTSNETSWDNVKGYVEGNILKIYCQNDLSYDTISWLVIGERCDEHMLSTEWTDENGRVIQEQRKDTA